ncbi:UbiA family prenyltransferase [Nocardia sp. NPDC058114]|uniref:UbiA family prenyltransferase n=1 Tax=Nocardia sp. NPDC058114 TaxID=3346346 RepID=UPI0036DD64AC
MSAKTTEKLVAYVRLSKVSAYQHFYLWILVSMVLWCEGHLDSSENRIALACFIVASIFSVASSAAADDVVGFRDGSDAANYSGEYLSRDVRTKPLLLGMLTESQAVTFATTAWFLGLMTGFVGIGTLGWRVPVAGIILFVAVQMILVQYNWGVRISARPLGCEAVMFVGQVSATLLPYWAITGRVTALVVYLTLLQGIWLMTIPAVSNAGDVDGDRAAGRNTTAVVAGPEGVRAELLSVWVVSAGLLVMLCREAGFRWSMVLVFLPLLAVQGLLLWSGVVQQNWAVARKAGFASYGVGTVTLLVFVLGYSFGWGWAA